MTLDTPRSHPLDEEHLERQTFGDRLLERELLALFAQQCIRLLPIVAGNAPRVERADAAHTLKGAALAVGAGRVASLADTLEGALDNDMPDETLARLTVKLRGAVGDVSRAIARRWRKEAA